MPELQAYVEDDDDFGDFECASSSLPYSLPNLNPQAEEDDEWGDFVENPLQFHALSPLQTQPLSSDLVSDFQVPVSDPPKNPPESQLTHLSSVENLASPGVVAKQWEKPQGAIPLSIFGDEEEEEEEPSVDLALGARDGFPPKREVGVKSGANLGSGVSFDDLILNLYGRDEQIKTGVALNSDSVAGVGDFDESCWEFKDAFSETGGGDGDFGKEQKIFEFPGFEAKENMGKSEIQVVTGIEVLLENGSNFNLINGSTSFDENSWAYGDAFPEAGTVDGSSEHKKESKVADTSEATFDFDIQVGIGNGIVMEKGSNYNTANENTNFDENGWEFKDVFLEARTRDGSFEHEKECEVAYISGAESKVPSFDGEIQVGTGNGVIENGSNFNCINGNSHYDESGWGFKDTFPEAEAIHGSSEHKGFKEILENRQRTPPLSSFSNGERDSGDMFDAQDGVLHKPTASVGNSINGFNPGSTIAFSDLISNLYSQAEQSSPVKYAQKPIENGFNSAQLGLNSDLVNGDNDWDENGWEFKDAFSEARTENLNSGFETVGMHTKIATDSKLKNFVDFYSRLKEESCFFVLHHLHGLKKAKKIAALSGEEEKVVALDEKIQATYLKLQEENVVAEKNHLEEDPLRKSRVHELLEVVQDPKFRVLELEYNLSKRLPSAEEDLRSAVALLEHAASMLHIMTLASEEEQHTYITTWSKMVLACAQELQHGAMIWMQSFEKNVHLQISSEPRGLRYFVSLGEIYRVAEVLRASATLYKPWILSNSGDFMDIFARLEECKSAWMDSGLKEALESISNSVDLEYNSTVLLESIEVIHELDELALQNLLGRGGPICRLSLLSFEVSQDMKTVLWNGEHYFLKLANLWANRISCDPPVLPHIHVH